MENHRSLSALHVCWLPPTTSSFHPKRSEDGTHHLSHFRFGTDFDFGFVTDGPLFMNTRVDGG